MSAFSTTSLAIATIVAYDTAMTTSYCTQPLEGEKYGTTIVLLLYYCIGICR